jgi:hypothetical protein
MFIFHTVRFRSFFTDTRFYLSNVKVFPTRIAQISVKIYQRGYWTCDTETSEDIAKTRQEQILDWLERVDVGSYQRYGGIWRSEQLWSGDQEPLARCNARRLTDACKSCQTVLAIAHLPITVATPKGHVRNLVLIPWSAISSSAGQSGIQCPNLICIQSFTGLDSKALNIAAAIVQSVVGFPVLM